MTTSSEAQPSLTEGAKQSLLDGLEQSMGKILEDLMEKEAAERACLVFINDHHIYRGPKEKELTFPFSSTVVETLLEDGIGLVSFDPEKGEAPSTSIQLHGLRSAMADLVEDDEGLLGILYCDTTCTAKAFSEQSLEQLKSLSQLMAPAVRLHMELRS